MRCPSALCPLQLRCSLSFAAATSLTSSPYVKDRPDNEWTMAVLCASCFLIASKMGRRGSVEAILRSDLGAQVKRWEQRELYADKEILCRERVRGKKLRAHMAVRYPRGGEIRDQHKCCKFRGLGVQRARWIDMLPSTPVPLSP